MHLNLSFPKWEYLYKIITNLKSGYGLPLNVTKSPKFQNMLSITINYCSAYITPSDDKLTITFYI
jgi:hypothetical protein